MSTSLRLPDVITVVESLEDLKDKFTNGELFFVALGLGIPYFVYDAVSDGRNPTPASVGAVTWADITERGNAGDVRFDNGHPQIGNAYARYPTDERRYVSVLDFDRVQLAEKSVEATRLLLALGAIDIDVRWHIEKGSKGSGGAQVQLADLPPLGVEAGGGSWGLDRWSSVITGADGVRTDLPTLEWLTFDGWFQAAIEAADHHAESIQFQVSSSQGQLVSASLITDLKKLKVNLRGEYKRWNEVSLTIRGRFPGVGATREVP